MRRSFKGAAAVAALCAGALTMTSLAVAAPNPLVGSGSNAGTYAGDRRLAGRDRIQTSLETLNEFKKNDTVNLMIVGYQGVVDALSLPPLAKAISDSAVLYSDRNGLDSRVINAIKERANYIGNVYISGGFGAVPVDVYYQLVDAGVPRDHIYRMAGKDRFETAYLTGALALDTKAGNKAMVGRDLQKVNFVDRVLATFARIEAEYQKAAAEKLAADDALAAAISAENAANKKVNDELGKIASGLQSGALKNAMINAASAIAADTACIGNLNQLVNPKMKAVLDFKKNDPKWKDTTIAAAKSQLDAKLGKYLDEVLKANKCLAVGKIAVDTDSLGQANKAMQDEIAATQAHSANALQAFLKANVVSQQADNNNYQLTHDSPFTRARDAYFKAQQVTADARTRDKKATADYKAAETDYISALAVKASVAENHQNEVDLRNAVTSVMNAGTFRIFLATGMNYADALTAGPAAARAVDEKGQPTSGVVLLTNNNVMPSYVADAVNASKLDVYGIGGPAADSFAKSVRIVGQDRYETSTKVALTFFHSEQGVYALASGQVGADAVVAGVYVTSAAGDPVHAKAVLLTTKSQVPAPVADFIQYGDHAANQHPVTNFVVFGGEGVIERGVVLEAEALSHN